MSEEVATVGVTVPVSVTLGIPTYSRLRYLKESTASALSQTYPNLEILISQNPHPNLVIREEIANFCRNLASGDHRVRYQLLPRDLGPPANFNAIADAARGEYLITIGDDDRLLPHAVEILADKIRTGTVLVFGRRHIMDSRGRRLEPEPSLAPAWFESQGRVPPGRLGNPELWAWQQAMAAETSLIHTRVFRRLRFREDIDMPDLAFFILLARERGEFISTPEYVTEYRIHSDSSTGRGFINYRELADLLAPLMVTSEVEPEKNRQLMYLTRLAILQSLSTGDVHSARRWLKSGYFTANAVPTRICAALPGRLAAPIFRAYQRLTGGAR